MVSTVASAKLTTTRGDVNYDGAVDISDVTALIGYLLNGQWPSVGPDYVDLGLPSGTMWATRNVGAVVPEDCGDYFAWGETVPKDNYTWLTYIWNTPVGSTIYLTKYNTKPENGDVDDKLELDPEDDAAYVNYPNGRMPSKEQVAELIQYCTWEWTTSLGVNGHLITGPNGNTMFLPAAGYYASTNCSNENTEGGYWTRSLSQNGTVVTPTNAHKMRINSTTFQVNGSSRNVGNTVRAVRALQNE